MYISGTGLVIGFHGTDQSVVDNLIQGKGDLTIKANPYDWLGHGIYFWENSPSRAMEWAIELSRKPKTHIKKPAVVGAIIELGRCLDFLDYNNTAMLKMSYETLKRTYTKAYPDKSILETMPHNTGGEDLLYRKLDCAVIETLHGMVETQGYRYDSLRGVFWEGRPVYEEAGFREKNHIQICVRNINCIKGYFLPLKRIEKYNKK